MLVLLAFFSLIQDKKDFLLELAALPILCFCSQYSNTLCILLFIFLNLRLVIKRNNVFRALGTEIFLF